MIKEEKPVTSEITSAPLPEPEPKLNNAIDFLAKLIVNENEGQKDSKNSGFSKLIEVEVI